MPGDAAHWNDVWTKKPETGMSWFEDSPDLSLDLIARHAPPQAGVIDVGGGASRLVDGLLDRGHAPLAVLDLAPAALAVAQARLGARASGVRWIAADITTWQPDQTWPVWHDRAVLHFLTDPADQAAYVAALDRALAPGGTAILATFAPDGPERCSSLPVQRHTPESLTALLDRAAPGRFHLVQAQTRRHVTPGGAAQAFQYSVFRHAR